MGLLLANLRRHFAEFLQCSSLKRLGILYHSTCVGLGYDLNGGLFPGTAQQLSQSNKGKLPLRSVTSSWPRNINLVPIDYAFRPRLRGRLTLLRLALSRNPWNFGDRVSHSVYRYSCQHSHFCTLQNRSPTSFAAYRTLRYHALCASSASAHGLSPGTSSPQDNLSRPVSCYAFFK